jgi:arsenate reductase (thioredoxin)
MTPIKVLFVCIHNSARSQIAEAFLNSLGESRFIAESAGLEPGELNLVVVEAMKEIGFDISKNKTKSVFDFYKQGKLFNYVITVCDRNASERCPIFPGMVTRMHWSFDDPASFDGTPSEKLNKTRLVRDSIKERIQLFIREADER